MEKEENIVSVLPDPIYSPAMQSVIANFRKMIAEASDTILSDIYVHSVKEGHRAAKDEGTRAMMANRLSHIEEMIEVHGHSEVAKEFRNLAEGMIKSTGHHGEKNLAQWIQSVTIGVQEIAKGASN